jgi:hypothetical protein
MNTKRAKWLVMNLFIALVAFPLVVISSKLQYLKAKTDAERDAIMDEFNRDFDMLCEASKMR